MMLDMGENRTLEFGEKENMNNMEERSNNSSEESGTINKVMTIPNIMSMCRIVLIVPFIICFLNEKYIEAAVSAEIYRTILAGRTVLTDL